MSALLTVRDETISAGDRITGDITGRAHGNFNDVCEAVMAVLRG